MKKGILIGISGASGSGKTLVAQNIYNRLGSENLVIIQEDSYYKDYQISHLMNALIKISTTLTPLITIFYISNYAIF